MVFALILVGLEFNNPFKTIKLMLSWSVYLQNFSWTGYLPKYWDTWINRKGPDQICRLI